MASEASSQLRRRAAARKPAKTATSRTDAVSARRETILDVALHLFSSRGLHGASLDAVADLAGVSKTNLLYHFGSKDVLYVAVLRRILDAWLAPLQAIDAASEPAEAIGDYIRRKLAFSRDQPEASRLFCLEIVQGAAAVRPELEGPLRTLVDEKSAVIRAWSQAGKIAAVDPHHLIFTLWATTQHYADFAAQVEAVTGRSLTDPAFFEEVLASVQGLVIGGLRPRPEAGAPDKPDLAGPRP